MESAEAGISSVLQFPFKVFKMAEISWYLSAWFDQHDNYSCSHSLPCSLSSSLCCCSHFLSKVDLQEVFIVVKWWFCFSYDKFWCFWKKWYKLGYIDELKFSMLLSLWVYWWFLKSLRSEMVPSEICLTTLLFYHDQCSPFFVDQWYSSVQYHQPDEHIECDRWEHL